MWLNVVILHIKITEKAKKDLNLNEISKTDEGKERSPGELCCPEDLEAFDAETETGTTKSRQPYDKQLTN